MARLHPCGQFCRSLVGCSIAGCLASVLILCDVVAVAEVWAMRACELGSSIELNRGSCEPDAILEEALASAARVSVHTQERLIVIKRRPTHALESKAKIPPSQAPPTCLINAHAHA